MGVLDLLAVVGVIIAGYLALSGLGLSLKLLGLYEWRTA